MIHNRKARKIRRASERLAKAQQLIEQISEGDLDPYEGYQQLYGIYLDSSGSLEDLKPLFRLPGIVVGGCFPVNDAFRATILVAAKRWLSGDLT